MTIYVVSGHPRSGTSMMMAALRAGGLDAVYSLDREQHFENKRDQASGFNPSGVWELELANIKTRFPQAYDGRLVKLVWDWLRYMGPHEPGYKVISMTRDPEEVHQSYEAAIGGSRLHIRHNYWKRYDLVMRDLEEHPDVKVISHRWYPDVLADPLGCFEDLVMEGWEIDPEDAAAVINPELYRFRKGETIVEGA